MNATTVELIFDRQLASRIWGGFTVEHLQYRRHPRQTQPHITLAVRELSGDAIDALHALANKLTPFAVSFGAAGIFLRQSSVRLRAHLRNKPTAREFQFKARRQPLKAPYKAVLPLATPRHTSSVWLDLSKQNWQG